jgi:hypothetical protein
MHLVRLRSFSATLFLAFVLGFLATSAHAIDVNARIKGTVTDPSGAVVPGASVTATNIATGVHYPTKTSSSGDYLFPQLPVGTYTVTVSMPGFKKFEATGIILDIDQEYVEAVKLEVGNTTETLEVAADAVQVNTTDMQLSNVVNSSQMVELPLIGRNFTGLELISPGVQNSSDRFGSYSASGSQTQQSEYLINGADTNDLALNTQMYIPSLDTIDQFNLIEGPLNAEYDRNSGGIVSATIKQGTNHFHGDAFEFYRDTFLNTPTFFQTSVTPTGISKTTTPYHQNIFGGTIGGPILKDKFFGFFGYQGTHQRVPGTNGGGNAEVFSPAMRGGDFTSDLGAGNGTTGYAFIPTNPIPGTLSIGSCPGAKTWGDCLTANGGHFATTDFSPISAKLLQQYVPQPNSGSYNYVFTSVTATTANQYLGRLDYAINPNNQIYFVGVYQSSAVASNIPFTGATLPGFGEVDATHVQQYTADYVHQFGPTLVNEFAAHYSRFNYNAVGAATTQDPATYGFDIHPQDTAAQNIPTIATGYFTLGFSTNGPQPRIDQVYQLDDNMSKTHGHHSFKFGYDGRKFNVSNPFYANNSGSYGFSSSGNFSSGDPGLDFLLGNSNSYAQGSGAEIQALAYLNYLYVQDSWKATNTLTVSYGLGYQIDTPLHNQQYGGEAVVCFNPGKFSTIFPTAPEGLAYPGDPGCTNSSQAYTRWKDFGPRFGFAWAPDLGRFSGAPGKFSIRGGFGIYYDRSEEETSLNNLQTPPFGLSDTGAVGYGGAAPAFGNPYEDIDTGTVYKNKFPYVFPTKGTAINYGLYEPLSLSMYSPSFRSPYAENFQLTMEREFPSRVVARLSYVASLSRRNQVTFEGNPETQAGHDACLADTAACGDPTSSTYRTYQDYYFPNHTAYGSIDPNTGLPGLINVGYVGSYGISNYNSLQASVEKASTHGFSFQLSYTWSHAMDNASSYENAGYGSSGRGYNQFVPGLNYGDSTYDARQRLAFAPIYIVPFKSSASAFSPYNLLVGGWEISGITTLATGFPFDISYEGGSANSLWCSPGFSFYACPDEPNIVGPLQHANPRTKLVTGGTVSNRTAWFIPGTTGTTFTQAALGQFGNAHRDPYHGPGINDTDLVLAKNFNLGADGVRRLQLRLTSTNAFNHANFQNPGGTFGSTTNGLSTQPGVTGTLSNGSAGQISAVNSTYPARQTQIAVKFYF